MNKFWSRWKKPWSKEQCRRRYIEGSTITLRQLAVEAGRDRKVVQTWSAKGEWETARRQYAAKMEAEIQRKSVEKISDDAAQIAFLHFQTHRLFHETALAIGQAWLDQIRSDPAAISSIKCSELNYVSLVLDRAIAGERVAAALEYEDLNKAIQVLHKHGYLVIDPTQTNPA